MCTNCLFIIYVAMKDCRNYIKMTDIMTKSCTRATVPNELYRLKFEFQGSALSDENVM